MISSLNKSLLSTKFFIQNRTAIKTYNNYEEKHKESSNYELYSCVSSEDSTVARKANAKNLNYTMKYGSFVAAALNCSHI